MVGAMTGLDLPLKKHFEYHFHWCLWLERQSILVPTCVASAREFHSTRQSMGFRCHPCGERIAT